MAYLFAFTGAALVAALAWLAHLTLPARQAVRVRNAFLLRRARCGDWDWTPDAVPADFACERALPPEPIRSALAEADIASVRGDWARARALVSMIVQHARSERPIRADLASTWRGIVAGGGYCADFVRVYMAATSGIGLFCRQWAFSFDGFGGHGHTFVEVWDGDAARWAFLDVHNNVYAVRRDTTTPLDAQALRKALAVAPDELAFPPAGQGRLGFAHEERLIEYYRRGLAHWVLVFGNDVVTRERNGTLGGLLAWPGPLAHRVGSALGQLPPRVAQVDAGNRADVERMERLRAHVRLAGTLVAAFAALLVVQLLI